MSVQSVDLIISATVIVVGISWDLYKRGRGIRCINGCYDQNVGVFICIIESCDKAGISVGIACTDEKRRY